MLKQMKLYYLFVAAPFLALIGAAVMFINPVIGTIEKNPHPQINFTIFGIILFGGIFILVITGSMVKEAKNLADFVKALRNKLDNQKLRDRAAAYTGGLACIMQMIATSSDRAITHQEQAAIEHELNNARGYLLRRNALPQYLTGLLVGMGLLGTFIGLLSTLNDISVLISSFADLDMQSVDPILVFRIMIERMKAPMQSMGIAFSASMFGLLGSIILGLMMVGVRRLQGDIISTLSSEVARHIETALSFEAISFRGAETGGVEGEGLTAKILLRIEERLAEAGRARQRALTAEIDDFKKQRADMLQALAVQNETTGQFRSDLQSLGRQLGAMIQGIERAGSEVSTRFGELTQRISGETRTTHEFLNRQVEEQKQLRGALQALNLDERFAEAARLQQRALDAEMEDFREHRGEVLRALTAQTDANVSVRGELQQLGRQLLEISEELSRGNGEVTQQLSELTVQTLAESKESQRVVAQTGATTRLELQGIAARVETLTTTVTQGDQSLAAAIALTEETIGRESGAIQGAAAQQSAAISVDLRQLITQIETHSGAVQRGHDRQGTLISSLIDRVNAGSADTCGRVGQLEGALKILLNQIEEQAARLSQQTNISVSEAGSSVRDELQQLDARLHALLELIERGSGSLLAEVVDIKTFLTPEPAQTQEEESSEEDQALSANS